MEEILNENIRILQAQVYALQTLVGLMLAQCVTPEQAERALTLTKAQAGHAFEELDMAQLVAIDEFLSQVRRHLP